MKTNIYAMFDKKSTVYELPFYQSNDLVLLRSLQQNIATLRAKNAPSQLLTHAEDFAVFQLGTYDQRTATIELLELPLPVYLMHEVLSEYDANLTNPDQ